MGSVSLKLCYQTAALNLIKLEHRAAGMWWTDQLVILVTSKERKKSHDQPEESYSGQAVSQCLGSGQTLFVQNTMNKLSSFYCFQLIPSSCLKPIIQHWCGRNLKEDEDKIRGTFGVVPAPFLSKVAENSGYFAKKPSFSSQMKWQHEELHNLLLTPSWMVGWCSSPGWQSGVRWGEQCKKLPPPACSDSRRPSNGWISHGFFLPTEKSRKKILKSTLFLCIIPFLNKKLKPVLKPIVFWFAHCDFIFVA